MGFEFRAGGTGGNLGVDIVPLGPAVALHVLVSDLVRNALVAQSRGQPIEQRRCVAARDGRWNSFASQVNTNLVDQAS